VGLVFAKLLEEGISGGDRFRAPSRDFMRCFHQEKIERIAPARRRRRLSCRPSPE
jgi:hypothetical protein